MSRIEEMLRLAQDDKSLRSHAVAAVHAIHGKEPELSESEVAAMLKKLTKPPAQQQPVNGGSQS